MADPERKKKKWPWEEEKRRNSGGRASDAGEWNQAGQCEEAGPPLSAGPQEVQPSLVLLDRSWRQSAEQERKLPLQIKIPPTQRKTKRPKGFSPPDSTRPHCIYTSLRPVIYTELASWT
ncbi:hypothetical protein HPB47_001755 [Ixodes persulcatus]|uniref:Uncharacterized protein n=1 Tax=Ixodes persulcatus TaxID=34615 RepID=A0AC60PN44_IXOPE|nr:hypothetical protein HPB47_001755 [Ixodes persulcatus]